MNQFNAKSIKHFKSHTYDAYLFSIGIKWGEKVKKVPWSSQLDNKSVIESYIVSLIVLIQAMNTSCCLFAYSSFKFIKHGRYFQIIYLKLIELELKHRLR